MARRRETSDPRGGRTRGSVLGRLPGRTAPRLGARSPGLRRSGTRGRRVAGPADRAGPGGPVLGSLPAEFATLQWHGDTFELPTGAVLLASSDPYPNQAFRFERAYGVQFHLEVSVPMAETWAEVPAYGAYLDRVLGAGSLPRMIEDVSGHQTEMLDHARTMFESWLDTTAGART